MKDWHGIARLTIGLQYTWTLARRRQWQIPRECSAFFANRPHCHRNVHRLNARSRSNKDTGLPKLAVVSPSCPIPGHLQPSNCGKHETCACGRSYRAYPFVPLIPQFSIAHGERSIAGVYCPPPLPHRCTHPPVLLQPAPAAPAPIRPPYRRLRSPPRACSIPCCSGRSTPSRAARGPRQRPSTQACSQPRSGLD